MKIDLEKFICSLGRQCYCSLFNTITFSDIQKALADQGLEYKDSKLIETESKQEEITEFEKAIADIADYSRRHADVTPNEFAHKFKDTILDSAKATLQPEFNKKYKCGYFKAITDICDALGKAWNINDNNSCPTEELKRKIENLKEK